MMRIISELPFAIALESIDVVIIAIVVLLALWHILTWLKVAHRGFAFFALLVDSASLLMYSGTLVYSRLVPNAFMVRGPNPATALTGIALLGLLFGLVGLGLGICSSKYHERGGLSATLIAVLLGLLWLPASVV